MTPAPAGAPVVLPVGIFCHFLTGEDYLWKKLFSVTIIWIISVVLKRYSAHSHKPG
ncbi:hypothetical protein D3C81_1539050 [compost metagenome]